MNASPLRVVIADDERPARAFLAQTMHGWDDVAIVGEAATGPDAVELIVRTRPDLALLDLHMPELDGLDVVQALPRDVVPLVAFVTAHDEYAVRAFELSAIDYLLKPVDPVRLRHTVRRAQERLEQLDVRAQETERVEALAERLAGTPAQPWLRRIPVRKREDIVLLPVEQLASVVADGDTLHLTMANGERHSMVHRLKALEARLDPTRFLRLSRGILVNADMIVRISPMAKGAWVVMLRNQQQLPVSRLRARVLREELLRL